MIVSKSVIDVGETAFCYYTIIYYEGNEIPTTWNTNYLYEFNLAVYLYSENQPTTSGSYWHYVDGEPVIW